MEVDDENSGPFFNYEPFNVHMNESASERETGSVSGSVCGSSDTPSSISIRGQFNCASQNIKQLEHECQASRIKAAKVTEQLVTAIDKCKNLEEIVKKIELVNCDDDNPLSVIERNNAEAVKMLETGQSLLNRLESVNSKRRVFEYELTVDDKMSPEKYAQSYAEFLEEKFAIPSNEEIEADIKARAESVELDPDFLAACDELTNKQKELQKMIKDSIKYYKEMHERLVKAKDIPTAEELVAKEECITITDSQYQTHDQPFIDL